MDDSHRHKAKTYAIKAPIIHTKLFFKWQYFLEIFSKVTLTYGKRYLIVILICIFWFVIWTPFLHICWLLPTIKSSLESCLFGSFFAFILIISCVFGYWVEFLISFWILTSSNEILVNTFSHLVDFCCLFVCLSYLDLFLDLFLWCVKDFVEYHHTTLVFSYFWCCTKSNCSEIYHKAFPLSYVPVFNFVFSFINGLKIILLFSSAHEYLVFSQLFIKKDHSFFQCFLTLNYFVYVGICVWSLFLSTDHYVFIPAPYYSD